MSLGSGKKPVLDPGSGSRGQKGTGSGSRIRISNNIFVNGHKNVQLGLGTGTVFRWPLGSGSVIQDYSSKDLDPKEIITDPQHCPK
jgi:hypothetical protein